MWCSVYGCILRAVWLPPVIHNYNTPPWLLWSTQLRGEALRCAVRTFSHCNPVFLRKGPLGGGVVSSTTAPLCCAAAEEAGFLQPRSHGGPCRPLNGASHVSFTWNIKQHRGGRSSCLFGFGGQKDKIRRKRLFAQRMYKGSWVWTLSLSHRTGMKSVLHSAARL